ncbi:hypothetical protein LG301_02305 [Vreelandella venusta]|uniref:I78 family peptidase inhibitor n=1 Tax=Vreelandella venusta TaxID=44935 RepID=UPI0038515A32
MKSGHALTAVMQRHMKSLGGALGALLLAGCSSAPHDVAAPPPPSVEPSASQTCDASAVQHALGEPFNEANTSLLQSESGARQVRVLRPDSAATLDYREDRLNIHLGSDDTIEALRCG